MEKHNGYLFSKLQAIGTKSEAPMYFLQKFDKKELEIKKDSTLWEADPALNKYLNRKVTIEGELINNEIKYDNVRLYGNHNVATRGKEPKLKLELGSDIVYISKDMTGSQLSQFLEMSLLVEWPYRSIWEGQCPTTQLYDFTIEYKDQPIWQWSENRMFAEVITPVSIKGGGIYKFNEAWKINPIAVKAEGNYSVRAMFVASGQEITANFEVKFIPNVGGLTEASKFNLSGKDISIECSFENHDILELEYKDPKIKKKFTGKNITLERSQQGTLVTVVLEWGHDLFTKTLSVFIPAANLRNNAKSVSIESFAFYTTMQSHFGGPRYIEGQIQTYEIIPLTGNAW